MTAAPRLREYPFEPFEGELPNDLLRMTEPVTRVRLPDGRPVWLVIGYEEVCTVLSDPRFSRLSRRDGSGDEQPRELNMDGSAHACVRRVAGRAFTPRRIESYRPRVQQLVDGLLDAMESGGRPADIVSSLVAPLPMQVICEVLGVPAADRERFYAWIEVMNSITAYGSHDAAESQGELRAYLAGHIRTKRSEPGDDLLSAWVTVQSETDLTDEELVELSMGVLLGGLEINSTSVGLRALFQYPDQMAKLRAAPEKLPDAVEEILRYANVTSMFRVQTAVEDLELAGIRISAGDFVMSVPWVANRDLARFCDPNVFDIDRTPNPHLSFGFGPHFCLGAAIGRMQVEVSIGTLLRRYPALAPAVPLEELVWRHDRVNGGIAYFPVTW